MTTSLKFRFDKRQAAWRPFFAVFTPRLPFFVAQTRELHFSTIHRIQANCCDKRVTVHSTVLQTGDVDDFPAIVLSQIGNEISLWNERLHEGISILRCEVEDFCSKRNSWRRSSSTVHLLSSSNDVCCRTSQ